MSHTNEDARIVPLVAIGGDEYVVDVKSREWRAYAAEAAHKPFLEV